ncbi:MAG: hypothetical protein WCW68_06850 [Methanothrix sp.]|jgi:hypothetical protein
MKSFHLDFDDAYQYVAAERNDLVLVSFDADFDKTDMGRKTPADILDGGLWQLRTLSFDPFHPQLLQNPSREKLTSF